MRGEVSTVSEYNLFSFHIHVGYFLCAIDQQYIAMSQCGGVEGIINCCYNTHAWNRRVHTLALTNDSVLLILMTATSTGPSDRPCARVCCANLSPVSAHTLCWSVLCQPPE